MINFIPVWSKNGFWRIFREDTIVSNSYEELDSMASVADYYDYNFALCYAQELTENFNKK